MIKKILEWIRGDLTQLELYNKVVTHSRQELYFTELNIEDSVTGRFENIVLHLFLVINRIAAEEGVKSPRVRALQEAFVMDMDRNLREMGIGDMSVGKKVKSMAAGWFSTAKMYEAALQSDAPLDAMTEALFEQVYREKENAQAERLALHILALSKYLFSLKIETITQNKFEYPSLTSEENDLIKR
ncbi:ubiquinol-cytochrome C chaperone family protein [Temperatibacter marinus]|uniref:Ubiquinol-cytochrome C chaperone family protein n=1 Tax=Temperatibacter marinus TaxID=1456591 RepID=A0AA52EGS1_9PROT|nr:ubiquinol-cytochrome C chaperone family protein [Temperatibacter marinus]WND02239.1 ubiquinol-cytochrome C chaperone family protein [Temperatibacter marinus]